MENSDVNFPTGPDVCFDRGMAQLNAFIDAGIVRQIGWLTTGVWVFEDDIDGAGWAITETVVLPVGTIVVRGVYVTTKSARSNGEKIHFKREVFRISEEATNFVRGLLFEDRQQIAEIVKNFGVFQ